MKIDNSGKKFTYITALIIALFGAISAAFVWQLTDREELINEPPSGRTVTTAPTQPETATPTPVMLRLPNADAVPALVDDYTNDASPWKLVNKSTPFGDLTYVPNVQLAPVATQAGRGIDERSLRADTFADLQAMFQDAAADGHELRVGSGYRSYATQAAILQSLRRTSWRSPSQNLQRAARTQRTPVWSRCRPLERRPNLLARNLFSRHTRRTMARTQLLPLRLHPALPRRQGGCHGISI